MMRYINSHYITLHTVTVLDEDVDLLLFTASEVTTLRQSAV